MRVEGNDFLVNFFRLTVDLCLFCQPFEELQTLLMELFGMPLNTYNTVIFSRFYSFYDIVFRKSNSFETSARVINSLMVETVHKDCLAIIYLRENASFLYLYAMGGSIFWSILTMFHRSGDMLLDMPTKGNSDGLYASTDSEDRQIPLVSLLTEWNFKVVALWINIPEFWNGLFVHEKWIMVATTCEDHAIKIVKECFCLLYIRNRR